ncbi:ABC transporter ATP-binding protein [Shinella sp. G-2]|uniref:ABC transporter ATP-binding protein n=1 Tax=Shinella sp. G-2 TaxID=3133141 RepID=UPI003D04D2F0
MTAPAASLTIDRVGKIFRFNGAPREVLRDVSFEVGKGEIVGVLGASGCGKSTLLRLIVGLDRDYSGRIAVAGEGGSDPARRISMVFQDHRLFPWLTVAENVGLALDRAKLPRAEKRDRIRHYVDLVGLSDFIDAYPKQLSGGMAQRAAIARALVSEPEILLMDEPFGALDSLLRLRLQDELLRIWQHRVLSVVVVTHDIEEALYLGDRVIVLEANPGRIRSVIDVDIPRPRRRTDPHIVALKRECFDLVAGQADGDGLFEGRGEIRSA